MNIHQEPFKSINTWLKVIARSRIYAYRASELIPHKEPLQTADDELEETECGIGTGRTPMRRVSKWTRTYR